MLVIGDRTREADPGIWSRCSFMSCSVLPVRMACNCHCSFCFSKSSVSWLKDDAVDWRSIPVDDYYRWARANGATRLVITGGGEPLLKPDDVVHLIERGSRFFDEITCFTNGTYLTLDLAGAMQAAGLSYLCYSRHHDDDARCRAVMGKSAPDLATFFAAACGLPVRATCVMAKGYVDSVEAVWRYIEALRGHGVRQFTFKHTYTAYDRSVFGGSRQDDWAAAHKVDFDPFDGKGRVVARLPWGPKIRRIGDLQVCYYFEPDPAWERKNRICRSSNLLSDGRVYASLEDQRSLLFRLNGSPPPSAPTTSSSFGLSFPSATRPRRKPIAAPSSG